MRDPLLRSAELLFRDGTPVPVKRSAPVIQSDAEGRRRVTMTDRGQFAAALASRDEDQALEVWVQGTNAHPREWWREGVWTDLACWDRTVWGGSAERNLTTDGRPNLRYPTKRERALLSEKHGFRGIRVVERASALIGAHGDTKRRIRLGEKPGSVAAVYGEAREA